MFSPAALALLATTATAQYIPVIAAPPDNTNTHQVSPKVCGIIVGCILGLLFLGCLCEGIWRKRKLRRLAARQPDPEQDSVPSAPWVLLETVTDGGDEDADVKELESEVTDSKDSVDTDDGGSIVRSPFWQILTMLSLYFMNFMINTSLH
ncbi:hypothetical protein IW261DRAFT_1572550 [Armillaria novae-zelandiae]|uniref:Transmembrane protein n=1 Tax=Armillaria novae-zelandiae TaxID=153914 RepID=A0AA39TV76_9AGAR|nr:hypothetical protein IW261DRAFT_1572550 [Armillaria novae-zelandiae]